MIFGRGRSATIETAASDLEDVRARIPKLRLRLSAATTSAVVTVDGVAVTPPLDHRVNPGEHEVVAKRDGAVVYERRLSLPESASVEVMIDAPAIASSSPRPEPTGIAYETKPASGWTRAVPFYVGGAVLGVAAIGSFFLASSAESDVRDKCAAQLALSCDLDAAGSGRVRTWETIGWISAGVGVAALGVGIVLHARTDDSATVNTALRPSVGAINGLVVEGRF